MRIRSLTATLLLAVAATACGDNASPTAPTASAAQFMAPAVRHNDLTVTNTDINATIDKIFTSPLVRAVVHADWNWIVSQLTVCPPGTQMLSLQTYLNHLTTFLQANAPKNNKPKAALLSQLIQDMSSYVNEAIAACPAA